MKQSDIDRFAMLELKRCAVKTVNTRNRLAVLSSLIHYVTGEKPRLRFKLDGIAGELTAVSMADVDRRVEAATDPRGIAWSGRCRSRSSCRRDSRSQWATSVMA